MAIMLQNDRPLNAVQIIARIDDAVDNSASDWEKYDETLDPQHLVMLAGKEPTIFLCNFEVSAKDRASINNSIMQGVDEEGKPKVGLGSWQLSVARIVLKDIQNPASVPDAQKLVFTKDGRGYTDDRTLNKLSRLGIIVEIFNHFVKHTEKDYRKEAKN
jgi:hypothetical protein